MIVSSSSSTIPWLSIQQRMLKMLAGRLLETRKVVSLAVVRERRRLERQSRWGTILSVRAPAREWWRLQLIL